MMHQHTFHKHFVLDNFLFVLDNIEIIEIQTAKRGTKLYGLLSTPYEKIGKTLDLKKNMY